MVVELDLHPHRPKRLDKMGLARKYQSWIPGIKDFLGGRIEHPIAQPAIEHSNDSPYSGLGAMFPAQRGWKCVLVEYRRAHRAMAKGSQSLPLDH